MICDIHFCKQAYKQQGKVQQQAVQPADSPVSETEESLLGELYKNYIDHNYEVCITSSNFATGTGHPQETHSSPKKQRSSSKQLLPYHNPEPFLPQRKRKKHGT